MRILFTVFSIVCLLPLAVAAQSTSQLDFDKQYYLFIAPGVVSGVTNGGQTRGGTLNYPAYASLQIGGGAEWFLAGGLAFGGELACGLGKFRSAPVSFTYRDFKGVEQAGSSRASSVDGWLAVNLTHYFKRNARFNPFVTGGGAIIVRGEPKEAVNYGAGFQLWRSQHRGWRVEYRKFRERSYEEGHLRSLRIGLVIR